LRADGYRPEQVDKVYVAHRPAHAVMCCRNHGPS
jgi:hypothetical protein